MLNCHNVSVVCDTTVSDLACLCRLLQHWPCTSWMSLTAFLWLQLTVGGFSCVTHTKLALMTRPFGVKWVLMVLFELPRGFANLFSCCKRADKLMHICCSKHVICVYIHTHIYNILRPVWVYSLNFLFSVLFFLLIMLFLDYEAQKKLLSTKNTFCMWTMWERSLKKTTAVWKV